SSLAPRPPSAGTAGTTSKRFASSPRGADGSNGRGGIKGRPSPEYNLGNRTVNHSLGSFAGSRHAPSRSRLGRPARRGQPPCPQHRAASSPVPPSGASTRKYPVADVPADKLTHLIYAFAKVERGEIALIDSPAAIDKFCRAPASRS